MTLAERIDDALEGAVLVFGSLPPAARDLDLLARPDEYERLRTWLASEGFEERSGEWARFADCTVESLDLVRAAEWGVPGAELEALFAEALPIAGLERLVRPAPHHDLLMVAVRVGEAGELSAKRRARVERALAEDPEAWARAEGRAGAWSAREALATLRSLLELPSPAPPRRRPRPLVVTFSGVDGSGKTSQIEALKATLDRLGYDVVEEYVRIEWMTLTGNRALGAIAAPVKALAAGAGRLRRREDRAPATATSGAGQDEGRSLRERNRLVGEAWVLVVALAHLRTQRRAASARGTVVICDRYTLDAAVYLRFGYGNRSRFRLQTGLLRTLSPRPVRSYYLDVPAETAYARKQEQYGLEELTRLVGLYREEAERLGVRRLDGERPKEELCAEIAREVWRSL
jgi:thymidylate kinase